MRKTRSTMLVRFLVSGAVLAVLLGSAGRQAFVQQTDGPPPSRTDVVRTADGPVQGIVHSGVRQFLGIRYAAPPVGHLRWRPPQPPAPWRRTLDAVAFGNRCAQSVTLGVFAAPSFEEDCLFLNVFVPLNAGPSAQLPVMVRIHGGGNFAGESDDYDGSKLARQGGVVVVTINYRLNLFDFFAHPAIDREGHLNNNYGLMDQQLALEWVQRNVETFGGDPHNVTIFGESGGAVDVKAHMASPLSSGLFHRGIAVDVAGLDLAPTPTLEEAESLGLAFSNAVGCADQSAQCLRSLTVHQILEANRPSRGEYASGGDFWVNLGVVVDGTVIPRSWDATFATGEFNRVPLINGSTLDLSRWGLGLAELASGHILTDKDYSG